MHNKIGTQLTSKPVSRPTDANHATSACKSFEANLSLTDATKSNVDNETYTSYLDPSYLDRLGTFSGILKTEPNKVCYPVVKIAEGRSIRWRQPNLPESEYAKIFANDSEEMSQHYTQLRQDGLNISLDVYGILNEFLPIGSSGTSTYVKNAETTSLSVQSNIETFLSIRRVVAKLSFILYRADLILDDNAREEASYVNDEESARNFVHNFGSHFRLGTYELGGIYLCTAKASTSVTKEVDNFKEVSLSKLKEELGISSGLGGGGGGGARMDLRGQRQKGEGSCNESLFESIALDHKVTNKGPVEHNPERFAERLSSYNEFKIIKYPCNNLVPIWELLEKDGDERVRKAAVYVKEEISLMMKKKQIDSMKNDNNIKTNAASKF